MMRSSLLLTSVVAAGVACAFAALTSLALDPAGSARALAAPAVTGPPAVVGDEGELQARLEAQARELELLRERIAQLENRPVPVARAPVTTEERAVPAAPATSSALVAASVPDATFVASVDAALQQIRAEEEREAEARRYEEQLAGIDRRLDKLADRLGLSGYQVDEMRDVLRKQAASNYELRRAREESEDKALYKEQRKALEKETKAALATILTPEQLADYQRIEKKGKDTVVRPNDLKRLRDARTVRK